MSAAENIDGLIDALAPDGAPDQATDDHPWQVTDLSGADHLARELARRFWAKVDVGHPLGCWEWTASKASGGYGKFWVSDGAGSGRLTPAHRYSYELLVGPIPEYAEDGRRAHLDHLCRNPACVNPDHLEVVSARVNFLRGTGFSARNARKRECGRGHAYTRDNTWVSKEGRRQCRACWEYKYEAARKARAAKKARAA